MNADVINLNGGAPTLSGITCDECQRALEPDWIVWTGKRHLCGQCLESGGYETGFREAARRAGLNAESLALGTLKPDSRSQLLDVVLAELDRISALDTVATDNSRADCFAVGARWTIRMIREAIERGAPADPDAERQAADTAALQKEPE